MRDNHITDLLERRALGSLTASELDIVKAHTAGCSHCLHVYEVAQASLLLLQERASATVEPPPFFQTKVMAAIREQNLAPKRLEFLKMWQTARALLVWMGALVVMLLALTFLTDSQLQTEPSNLASISDDSPERVFLDQDEPDDEITSSQALTIIYDSELDAGGDYGKRP
jgi:Putative zinc-finger